MAQTVLVIKDATVQFAATELALATSPDYTCQTTSAAINANPNLQTVPATFCSPESQAPATTGWELALTVLQDWGSTDSISDYLFDNDATRAFFLIQPNDPAIDGMTGECWIVASTYLGDAGVVLTATVTLPCIAKPTRVPATTTTETAASSTSTGSDTYVAA